MNSDPHLRHEYRTVNGVQLHCVIAGSGPLVVLLHGFPECWYSWHNQLPALAQHYTVVAPDMRGYNLSSKPAHIADYAIDRLVEDIVTLIDSFGVTQADVIGHDWGGMVAWMLALTRPEVVHTLSVLNIPHPRLMSQNLLTNAKQRRRSWYIAFFQLPLLPELAFKADNYALLDQMLRGIAVRPDSFSDDDLAVFKAALAQPGAVTATLNYYRALARPTSQRAVAALDPVAHMPVQVIWGEQDVALGKELNDNLARYVPDLTLHFIPDASHWVQHDRPDLVNRYLLEFLEQHPVTQQP